LKVGTVVKGCLVVERDDDVRGVIIGGCLLVACLMYEGRKQGPTIYAEDEMQAIAEARRRIESYRESFGEAYRMIYPSRARWEVRIYV
jgi:hypothetical protein